MKKLLLLHGALGSAQQLDPLKQILSNQFEVYSFNFDGHGGKASTQDFSISLFTQNTLDFIQENNLNGTNIFGYSMGGYVALNLVKDHPQSVDKIFTLGTKFDWSLASAEQEVKMLNPEKIEEKVPAFAQQLAQRHQPNDWKAVLRQTAHMMLSLAKGEKLSKDDLQKIQHSVLIGIGQLDRMVSITESEQAASLLPNGTLSILENVKHPIEKVDVEQLASAIQAFLQ